MRFAMPKAFSLFALCFMMTLTLQVAGFNLSQQVARSLAANMATTYVPLKLWGHPAFELLAPRPEWQLRLEEQTKWWHFPFLSTASQRNAAFTLQLSYGPFSRTR